MNLSDRDTILTVSGGFECLAALWWSINKGYKPVGVFLRNNYFRKESLDSSQYWAEKQCEYFGIPLVVDEINIPQSNRISNAVFQWQSALLHLLAGNKDVNWKYIVWGANSEDSFRQRTQLRYPIKMVQMYQSDAIDAHGILKKAFLNSPINLFPFEHLTKSEVVALIGRYDKELLKLSYSCVKGYKILDEWKMCEKCEKCAEWKLAKQIAGQAKFKVQEGYNYGISFRS